LPVPRNTRERLFARSTLAPLKVPAFAIANALQDTEDASLQLDALALTFTLISQSAGIDPHDLITRAKRQVADADATRNPHLEAIRDYAAGELA
jgi:hypothetical protein